MRLHRRLGVCRGSTSLLVAPISWKRSGLPNLSAPRIRLKSRGGRTMEHNGRKIVIIGGGIAGLCTAVYALKCGYHVEVLEMHDIAGGLATSWKRGDYTFETCLHWLLGSNPDGEMYARWQEVFDIGKLTFVDPEEYARLETEHGDALSIYTNTDRMEAELLKWAPQDSAEIH